MERRSGVPARHALLFVASILLPCVLLVISARSVRQERELVRQQMAETSQRRAAAARQRILTILATVKLQVLSSVRRPPEYVTLLAPLLDLP